MSAWVVIAQSCNRIFVDSWICTFLELSNWPPALNTLVLNHTTRNDSKFDVLLASSYCVGDAVCVGAGAMDSCIELFRIQSHCLRWLWCTRAQKRSLLHFNA